MLKYLHTIAKQILDNGAGEMALTSDKVGNVTVQAIAQYKLTTKVANANGQESPLIRLNTTQVPRSLL